MEACVGPAARWSHQVSSSGKQAQTRVTTATGLTWPRRYSRPHCAPVRSAQGGAQSSPTWGGVSSISMMLHSRVGRLPSEPPDAAAGAGKSKLPTLLLLQPSTGFILASENPKHTWPRAPAEHPVYLRDAAEPLSLVLQVASRAGDEDYLWSAAPIGPSRNNVRLAAEKIRTQNKLDACQSSAFRAKGENSSHFSTSSLLASSKLARVLLPSSCDHAAWPHPPSPSSSSSSSSLASAARAATQLNQNHLGRPIWGRRTLWERRNAETRREDDITGRKCTNKQPDISCVPLLPDKGRDRTPQDLEHDLL